MHKDEAMLDFQFLLCASIQTNRVPQKLGVGCIGMASLLRLLTLSA